MKKYVCKLCLFQSKLKSNYNRHINTQKHINNVKRQLIIEKQLATISNTSYLCPTYNEITEKNINYLNIDFNLNDDTYDCKICNKKYKYSQGLSKHMRNIHSNQENKNIIYENVGKDFIEYGEPRILEYRTIYIEKTSL